MDILIEHEKWAGVDCAVFDFDGTLSKLRAGWETVMQPLMCELIPGEYSKVKALVDEYIDNSTGIQTILQMRWLAETIANRGGKALDPWDYKAEYLRRLMVDVEERKQAVLKGETDPDVYKVYECEKFLAGLKERGVKIFAASGTDEKDVKIEAEILGFDKYFDGIKGAVDGSDSCSKEAVLQKLVKTKGRLLVVGDGKVEIALGRERGALTLGIASNDVIGCCDKAFNMQKYQRLKNAGAHLIVSDFREYEKLLEWI